MIKKIILIIGLALFTVLAAFSQNPYSIKSDPELIGYNIYDVTNEIISRGLVLNYDTGVLDDHSTSYVLGCDESKFYCHIYYFENNECNLIAVIPSNLMAQLTMKQQLDDYWTLWSDNMWVKNFENGWRTVIMSNNPNNDIPIFLIE